MYHPTSIASLSEAQITKALKGLPVRVSAGNQHNIELSKEQLKKFAKANKLGKALNITLDPFQIQNHMKLIGSGVNRLKKAQRWEGFANATLRDGIDTAGKAARVYYDSSNPMAQMGFGIGGNITKVAKTVGKAVIQSSGDRAIRAIEGSGVNRLKKAQRWEGFANATERDGIDTAGKAARVYYDSTNPMAQLKKRGRPKRRGALYVAGTP